MNQRVQGYPLWDPNPTNVCTQVCTQGERMRTRNQPCGAGICTEPTHCRRQKSDYRARGRRYSNSANSDFVIARDRSIMDAKFRGKCALTIPRQHGDAFLERGQL